MLVFYITDKGLFIAMIGVVSTVISGAGAINAFRFVLVIDIIVMSDAAIIVRCERIILAQERGSAEITAHGAEARVWTVVRGLFTSVKETAGIW